MLAETVLKQTPLKEEHLKLNARMVPFAGWLMPVQYEGILREYEHCRGKASLFDTCHMGEFFIHGNAVKCGLDRIVTQNIIDLPIKQSRYGMMLNDDGRVIDDLIVFRIAEEEWMIVVNAGTIDKDKDIFLNYLSDKSIFKDQSDQTGKLDIQGPLARDILCEFNLSVGQLKYFCFDEFDILGHKCLISRTGYTGELGYEIYGSAELTVQLWQKLLEKRDVKPAGLGARDVLRLEVGYSLYGQDINETTSPLEAGLSRFCDFKKDFIGKEALEKEKETGPKRRCVSFISDSRRSPRHHHKIFNKDEKEIGVVTSGSFSPHLKKGIGLGLVAGDLSLKSGDTMYFGEEKNKMAATVSSRPFYNKGSLKN